MMAQATWTPEQDDRLMTLWRDSLSCTEIANSGEFGGATRNAIIGRLHRLRKKWGIEMVPMGRQNPPPPPVKKKRRRGKTNNFNVKERELAVVDPTPMRTPPAPPIARRLPLLQLGNKDCRFIVTDHNTRDHLYCAVDASAYVDDCGNNCYCAFHQRFMRAGGVVR